MCKWFALMNMNLKKQQLLNHLKKNVNLEQRFIFIDTTDVSEIIGGTTFAVDFGETLKNVVEIELMSCQMPKNGTSTTTGKKLWSKLYLIFR